MLRIEMTDDIRKYEPKFVGPFTARQCACIFIALIVAIPIFAFLPIKEIVYRIAITATLVGPILMCGYIKIDGSYLEVLAIRCIYMYILTSPKRKVKATNIYKSYFDSLRKIEEENYVKSLSKKERKKYEKKKQEKKVIKDFKEGPYKLYT